MTRPTVDLEAAEAAIASLLRALGLPPESDKELRATPSRVARMFADELLDGYAKDPVALLHGAERSDETALVVLKGLRYTSVCPHHLLPCVGRAALGYRPGGRVAGLGRLVKLLELFAHRLVLQEALGQLVSDALVEHLGAQGAGVVLTARHQCLSARGEKQDRAVVVTVATSGDFRSNPSEREAFLAALGARGPRLFPKVK